MINIIIHGCSGKMGTVLTKCAKEDPDLNLCAGIDCFKPEHNLGCPFFTSPSECNVSADVIIDFSTPSALEPLIEFAVEKEISLIVATTGLPEELNLKLKNASKKIPVFTAANMSLGVNLMYELCKMAATTLTGFDIEIVEKHHNQKVDSPSGTAYSLANVINSVFLNEKKFTFGRHSNNCRRSSDEIGIHAVRGGTIAGEHTAIYAGEDEVLKIEHTAHSKKIFAMGALKAAKYIVTKNHGMYTMSDMMTEHSAVTNIYTNTNQAMITINNLPQEPATISEIFSNISEKNIILDIISQTAPVNGYVNVSFTLPLDDLNDTLQIIGKFNSSVPSMRVDVYAEVTKLTVEGIGMEKQPGIASKVFGLMAKNDIFIKAITTSETKISYIIDQKDEDKAVTAIKKAFNI